MQQKRWSHAGVHVYGLLSGKRCMSSHVSHWQWEGILYFMRYNISLPIPQARPPVRGFELGPFAPLPRTEPLRYQALVKNDKFQNKKLKMKMKIKIKINFPF